MDHVVFYGLVLVAALFALCLVPGEPRGRRRRIPRAARNDRAAEVRGPYGDVDGGQGSGRPTTGGRRANVARVFYEEENAASGAGTSEAAEMVPNEERAGESGPCGHLHDNTF